MKELYLIQKELCDLTTITWKSIIAFLKIAIFLFITHSTLANLADDNIIQGFLWGILGFVLYVPHFFLLLLVKLGFEDADNLKD